MSIPSLRQQMINEALDYHMNMNHVVFNRERKHVETLGQQVLDKKQSDIIIEGNLRDRISRIMTSIQKLVQGVDFTFSPGAPSVPSGPKQPDQQVQSGPDRPGGPGGPMRSIRYVTDNITSILSEYNSLCDYIDLQGRQKPFSQSDISGIDALVKQLIDPLKTVISTAGSSMDKSSQENLRQYTRIYNVVKAIIDAIGIGFPFQKVSVSLLTERAPLIKEYVESPTFFGPGSDYLRNLIFDVQKQVDRVKNMPSMTQLQREAKEQYERALRQQLESLEMKGRLPPNILREINEELERQQFNDPAYQSYLRELRRQEEEDQDEEDVEDEEEDEEEEDVEESKGPVVERESKSDEGAQEPRRLLIDYITSRDMTIPSLTGIDRSIIGQPMSSNAVRQYVSGLSDANLVEFFDRLAMYKQGFSSQIAEDFLARQRGRGKPKKGGHIHKTEKFDDQAELEPYLTKHLRPSKYRKDVPPIESSSEESSGEEGDGSDMEINELRLGKGRKKKGTRKQRKQKQDLEVISKLPAVEATVLIEKKRGGAKKHLAPIHKPAIKDSGADKDLWFL